MDFNKASLNPFKEYSFNPLFLDPKKKERIQIPVNTTEYVIQVPS